MKIKVVGEFLRRVNDEEGNMEVTFKISNWSYRKWLHELEKDKQYSVEINPVKSQRSINQNNYLWKLIHEICLHENASSNDEWEMYCLLLERANVKYEWIVMLESAVETLKKSVRALRIVGYETRKNGTKWARCKVYLGSSKFNKEEMNKLIESTLEYAEQLGINTDFYEEVLK